MVVFHVLYKLADALLALCDCVLWPTLVRLIYLLLALCGRVVLRDLHKFG